jgi:hypothetical protein
MRLWGTGSTMLPQISSICAVVELNRPLAVAVVGGGEVTAV